MRLCFVRRRLREPPSSDPLCLSRTCHPPEEKITLFRGREDVYHRRVESRKTGRGGYAPACGNEWVRGVCEKPRIKCADCPNRRFLPITDEVIREHLSGEDQHGRPFAIGVYPLLLDETCFFLAIDLDG
jgi:hypothetical protein